MSDENPSTPEESRVDAQQPAPPSSTSLQMKVVLSLVVLGIVGVAFLVSPKFGVGMVMTVIVFVVLLIAGRGNRELPPAAPRPLRWKRKSPHEPSRHERGGGGLADRLSKRASRGTKP